MFEYRCANEVVELFAFEREILADTQNVGRVGSVDLGVDNVRGVDVTQPGTEIEAKSLRMSGDLVDERAAVFIWACEPTNIVASEAKAAIAASLVWAKMRDRLVLTRVPPQNI